MVWMFIKKRELIAFAQGKGEAGEYCLGAFFLLNGSERIVMISLCHRQDWEMVSIRNILGATVRGDPNNKVGVFDEARAEPGRRRGKERMGGAAPRAKKKLCSLPLPTESDGLSVGDHSGCFRKEKERWQADSQNARQPRKCKIKQHQP